MTALTLKMIQWIPRMSKMKRLLTQNQSKHGKKKRKRKSHSSTPEMMGFLREYGEKHEKVEEETLNLMKTMKQEKK